jgi:hypothetical protein
MFTSKDILKISSDAKGTPLYSMSTGLQIESILKICFEKEWGTLQFISITDQELIGDSICGQIFFVDIKATTEKIEGLDDLIKNYHLISNPNAFAKITIFWVKHPDSEQKPMDYVEVVTPDDKFIFKIIEKKTEGKK